MSKTFAAFATPWFLLAILMVGTARESLAQSSTRDQLFQQLAQEVAALERQGNLIKKVAKLVKPSVVHIDATKTEDDGVRRRRVHETGSGVIVKINADHYIITNRHVIKDTPLDEISVGLDDGRSFHPARIWADRDTDLAVMSLDAKELVPARLGDSNKLEIGDFVLAMGSPFGLSHSVTFGIVSAKGRRDLSLGSEVRYQNFIQTDAAINPGNSGGPLLNLRGEVVGINTAIASSGGGNEGIGFSIPINMAWIVVRQLVEKGTVSRAFLGVHLDSRFGPDAAARLGLAAARGARVTFITPQSPAAEVDFRVGDVILKYKDVQVEDDSHLVNLVSMTPVGEEVPVVIYRNGQPVTVKVKVGARQAIQE